MENSLNIFRIVCTQADFDNIQEILMKMGLPFDTYNLAQLEDPAAMQNVDILFINCAGPEPSWTSAQEVRTLVERGGALYISCYAHKWLDLIWPEYMEFHAAGEIQKKVHARIINPGLQDFLGGLKEFDLHYDTHWHGIKKIKKRDGPDAVYEYMRGIRQGNPDEEALLVSFHFGQGFVIFTTFHNSKQVSELESKLLQYMVLRPLMESKTFESNTIIMENAFTPTKEVLGSLKAGEESQLYTFLTNREYDLKFIYNWKGKATTKATVIDPHGKVVVDANIRSSPKIFDISKAIVGKWSFKIKMVDAPLANFPFIINVGIKEAFAEENTESSSPESASEGDEQEEIVQLSGPKRISLELLQPVHRVIGQLELTVGKQYEFGRNQIPNDVAGRDSVSSKHLVLQLLDSNQVLIKDVSSYGTGAATMKSNSYDTKPLTKNIPIAFKLPIILNLANVILLSLH